MLGDVLKMKLPGGRNLGEELKRQDLLAPGGAVDQLLKQPSLEKLFGNPKRPEGRKRVSRRIGVGADLLFRPGQKRVVMGPCGDLFGRALARRRRSSIE